MHSAHKCSAFGCNNLVYSAQDRCSECEARWQEYLRRKAHVPASYEPVKTEIDRTTPGQHNLKIDLAKELKPITAVEPMTAEQITTAFTVDFDPSQPKPPAKKIQASLAQKYPAYYKSVQDYDYIDAYAVHHLFGVQDCSGMLQHASKKLLLSGVRTGNKSKFKDVKEARDTLNRWMELNPEE